MMLQIMVDNTHCSRRVHVPNLSTCVFDISGHNGILSECSPSQPTQRFCLDQTLTVSAVIFPKKIKGNETKGKREWERIDIPLGIPKL